MPAVPGSGTAASPPTVMEAALALPELSSRVKLREASEPKLTCAMLTLSKKLVKSKVCRPVPLIPVTVTEAVFIAASLRIPTDCPNEYWFAGAIKDSAIPIVKGPTTGLPLPATAELVLEGECTQGDTALEGPFGECPGYYVSKQAPAQAVRVKAVLHRHEPILLGRPPIRPQSDRR